MRNSVARWLAFVALVAIFAFSWINLTATTFIVDFPVLSRKTWRYDQIVTNGWGIVVVLSFVGALTILFLNIRWHRHHGRSGSLPDSSSS